MRFSLEPPPGLFSDDTTFASPGVWDDGSNVRAWLGKMQVIGGWTRAFTDALEGVCRNIHAWTDADGALNIAFGTHTHLFVYKGGALYDITPAGLLPGSEHGTGGAPGFGSGPFGMGPFGSPASTYWVRTWSFANYGEWLIANPRGGNIYVWENAPLSPATVVTNAPTRVNGILVTPERQLVAFGCNEELSGDYNPLCIRGTDIEDIEAWTVTAANNAFEHVLEGGGRIAGQRLIGPYVAIWTDAALHQAQFVGQLGQTYQIDRVADNCGLAAPNAVHIEGQSAFWVSSDYQFRAWQLGGKPDILRCPIWKDFADNLVTSQKEKIVASGVSKFGEVWFHYPDTRDGNENSRYLAYSITESISNQASIWFKGILARSAAVDAGVATNPIMVSPDGKAFYHEHGNTADGGSLSWFLKSADQYLEEGGVALQLQGVRPDFENQAGSIDLTIAVRTYAQEAPVIKGPFSLPVNAHKRDFRVTGQIASFKFAGTEYMRLGRPVFPAVAAGRRA